jgi:hypothetical protein
LPAIAVDPTDGNVYVVYQADAAGTGNSNQLYLERLIKTGTTSGSFPTPEFREEPPQLLSAGDAALPGIAVTTDGTVGVLYDTFDGVKSGVECEEGTEKTRALQPT